MTMALTPRVLVGAHFTTYRIGGTLDEAYQPASEADMVSVLQSVRQAAKPLTLLGWGGNTLIASRGIRGVTLITRKLDWIEPLSGTRLSFGAGVHLAKASNTALKQGLSGGEYMIGLPGTIGGAVRMNAGALKQETATLVRCVRIFNMETGEIEDWQPEQLQYSYRKSAIVPGKHVVLSAELEFTQGDPDAINRMMADSVWFRKAHHPKEPNGGSVFKNPSMDMPVGRLIEELGGKGQWHEGAAMISPMHGNFIINLGNATSTDVLRLMLRMKRAIAEQYGLNVHPENLFIGDATDEEQAIWEELTA